MKREPHGIMAGFSNEADFLAALRLLRQRQYVRVEAYTPYAVSGVEELLPQATTPIPWLMLLAGTLGAATGFFLQDYATHDYPLNIGGRPLTSWPSFIPITFELTVLSAALTGVLSFFCLARFPNLHHPVFNSPEFRRASLDRYFVCVRADDPKYAVSVLRGLLAEANPESIAEVFA